MRLLALLFFWITASSTGAQAEPFQLTRSVLAHPPYHGQVPPKSAVVFSTRFPRPEAFEAAKAFGATRIEWVYSMDSQYVSRLRVIAPWFGGTLNANGTPGGLPTEDGYAKDFDGQTVKAPWMSGWDGRWLSVAHPDSRKLLLDQAKQYAALNAASLHFDDPVFEYYAGLHQAGDFNPATLRAFPEFLANYPDRQAVRKAGLEGFSGDYRELLRERFQVRDRQDYLRRWRTFPTSSLWLAHLRASVHSFFLQLRSELKNAQRRELPISMNLTELIEPSSNNPHFFLAALADYSMAESQIRDYSRMVSQAATARALGMGYIASLRPQDKDENRAAIASLYAMGAPVVVPWDVYTGSDAQGKATRYFGTSADYGDLYKFVRTHSSLLDGFEPATVVGVVADVNYTPVAAIRSAVALLAERQIPFAFVPVDRGQRYPIEATRIERLKSLVVLDGVDDRDQRALAALDLPQVRNDTINAAWQEQMRPFILSPGAERVRLFPRAFGGDPSRLVIHVVDTSAAPLNGSERECRRRLGVKRGMVPDWQRASAQWATSVRKVAVTVDSSPDGVFVTLPTCPLWGILEIKATIR
jgi:hypothetical protein